ncbi:hypothetical protein TWF970_004662 [Orbilia oligospora]|uniref:chitinase n=1 Tax=Orbilia oligospora TaxID=2813651 RepID=A0A7C8VNF3_ORBOL|nr:hypothetical protein TWF970_004662 [Orbilia oligospora]
MASTTGNPHNWWPLSFLNIITFTFLFLITTTIAQDFTCSPTKRCKEGCCSKDGWCGYGPTSCSAENCISDCDRKSACNPGWGMQWSASQNCPLNVCCSPFGFCGTTPEFCGSNVIASPSCPISKRTSAKRTVGYWESWGVGRGCDAIWPEDINAKAYTHLNFAFAFIDPVTFAVSPMGHDPSLYKRLTSLKKANPALKVYIAIGGWSMNDPDQPTATTFSDVAGSTTNQNKFFNSLISFMATYGFDGVDIDWEYPVAPERSGTPADKANFVTMLRNMRTAFQRAGRNYGITITIPASFWYLQHFDIVNIEKVVDWINVMSYDLRGEWDKENVWTGPYIGAHTNLTEIDQMLKLLWRNNINPDNIVLGIGFYGRAFQLENPACTTPGCRFSAASPPGACTAAAGYLSYSEITRLVAAGNPVTYDPVAGVKWVTWNQNGAKQWVSWDDAQTIKLKVDYANSNCLGGTMVWSTSLDTKDGQAAQALSGPNGSGRIEINNNVALSVTVTDSLSTCRWAACGASCPDGMSPAQNSKGNQVDGDRRCPGQTRLFCCPSNDVPRCEWNWGSWNWGAENTGLCGGGCSKGWVEVGTSTEGCSMGHRALCCEPRKSVEAIGKCHWDSTSPFCKRGCGSSGRTELVSSRDGDGGEQICQSGQKSFCCDQPPPFTNCAWQPECNQPCELGKYLVTASYMEKDCFGTSGCKAFCCDPPGRSVSQIDRRAIAFGDWADDFLNSRLNQCPAPHIILNPRGIVHVPEFASLKKTRSPGNSSSLSLSKRQFSGGKNEEYLYLLALVATSGALDALQRQIRDQWNDLAVFRTGLTTDVLGRWLRAYPGRDRVQELMRLFCLTSPFSYINRVLGTATQLCHVHGGPRKLRRDVSGMEGSIILSGLSLAPMPMKKRTFIGELDATYFDENRVIANWGDAPTVGRLLRLIVEGRLRQELFRFFGYRQGTGTIVEVVYLLGREPNHMISELQEHLTDRYAVFHYHIRGFVGGSQAVFGADAYLDYVHVFHTNTLETHGGPNTFGARSRPETEQERYARAQIFACPDNESWLATDIVSDTQFDYDLTQITAGLARRGVFSYRPGIVDTDGSWAFQWGNHATAWRLTNGETAHPGWETQYNPAANGLSPPYYINPAHPPPNPNGI